MLAVMTIEVEATSQAEALCAIHDGVVGRARAELVRVTGVDETTDGFAATIVGDAVMLAEIELGVTGGRTH